eukprot:gb/GECH01003590.1/.p1 GENE.gb/GECH01003590.1/~~gb/GECH01003590.1/.p1  ORF type:complete len:858 (+),score=219.34 gb/GECH01003590.1/:1-2574(+)
MLRLKRKPQHKFNTSFSYVHSSYSKSLRYYGNSLTTHINKYSIFQLNNKTLINLNYSKLSPSSKPFVLLNSYAFYSNSSSENLGETVRTWKTWKNLSLTSLPGLGTKRVKGLNRVGIQDLGSLIQLFPKRFEDRRRMINVDTIPSESIDSKKVLVTGFVKARNLLRPASQGGMCFATIVGSYKSAMRNSSLVRLGTESEQMEKDKNEIRLNCRWFRGGRFKYPLLKTGTQVVVYGQIQIDDFKKRKNEKNAKNDNNDKNNTEFTISHPHLYVIRSPEDYPERGLIPVYPIPSGTNVSQQQIRNAINSAVQTMPGSIDFVPNSLREEYDLLSLRDAIKEMHFPSSMETAEHADKTVRFNELFRLHVLFSLIRRYRSVEDCNISLRRGDITEQFLNPNYLPFDLTQDQYNAIQDIQNDLENSMRMQRIIVGDVGSGKTVVALAAVTMAADSGYITILMTPSTVLCRQHYNTLQNLLKPLGIQPALLLGTMKSSERRKFRDELKRGEISIIVGTTAVLGTMLEELEASHRQVGLCIVDEQQRFGVMQRGKLLQRWREPPHTLYLSATPIPRSLAMAMYGDLDVSTIKTTPSQKNLRTSTLVKTYQERSLVSNIVKNALDRGRQAFVIFPLVDSKSSSNDSNNYEDEIEDETEENNLEPKRDIISGYQNIQKEFSEYKVGMVHGKMKENEKSEAMNQFRNGETQILCATTVVEVGVDVPNATVMLIENANSFGLQTLHQLRGRVGRGEHPGTCILMSPSSTLSSRLNIMKTVHNGFDLSELDMKLRGTGDLTGDIQSGNIDLPFLKRAHLLSDRDLSIKAMEYSNQILEKDPNLKLEENSLLRYEVKQVLKQVKGTAVDIV